MKNKSTALDWLSKAEDDANWTKANIREKIYYGACFTAQQAAEKALKAYLYTQGIIPAKIHDLRVLVKKCSQFEKSFLELKDLVVPLVDYYAQTRYPDIGDLIDYSKEKAQDALKRAQKVIKFVKEKLA